MRKKYVFLLFAASVCMMAGCGKGNVSDVQIDYGDSAIYSKEDMDDRIPETIKIRVSETQPASPPSGELILWIKKE